MSETVNASFWVEAEERFAGAVQAHCRALGEEPGSWAALTAPEAAWEGLVGSSSREARDEAAFLWTCAPSATEILFASRRALETLARREG